MATVSKNDRCRCCLVESDLWSIFDNISNHYVPFCDMLKECISLDVKNGDGMPPWICMNCANKLCRFSIFRKKCIENHATLLSELNSVQDIPIKIENDDSNQSLHYNYFEDDEFIMAVKSENEFNENKATSQSEINDMNVANRLNDENINENNKITLSIKNAEPALEINPKQKEHVGIGEALLQNNDLPDEDVPLDICFGRSRRRNRWDRCYQCGKRFTKESSYMSHMFKVHDLSCDTCWCECGEEFENEYFLQKHREEKHVNIKDNKEGFVCKLCTKPLRNKKNLKNHMEAHVRGTVPAKWQPPPKPIQLEKGAKLPVSTISKGQRDCPYCLRRLDSYRGLLDHVRCIHYGVKYFCDICNKYYYSESNHMLKHVKPSWANCKICKETFKCKYNFTRHMKDEHGVVGEPPRYVCQCGLIFKFKEDYRHHRAKIHNDKDYVCHLCSKAYTAKRQLDIHIRTHTQEKNFVCKLCEKRFITNSALSTHLETHKDSKDFKCDNCGQTFKLKNYLIRHMEVHDTTIRTYNCPICQKCFTRPDNRNTHLSKIHHLVRSQWLKYLRDDDIERTVGVLEKKQVRRRFINKSN